MFGRAGLTVQAVLAVTAAVVLLAVPGDRPAPGDGVATSVPLASLLLLAGLATVLGLAHEAAHVPAAWAAGVPSRIPIGRRMIFVVYQTDLTRLWSVPAGRGSSRCWPACCSTARRQASWPWRA